jgi:hypothetical protein
MAGVVFKAHTKLKLAQRHPDTLTTPTHVDDFLLIRKKLHESLNRLWCLRVGLG